MTPSLKIINSGLSATVQDFGRDGYQRFGVPVSGALDKISMAAANALVDNPPAEAVIEVVAAGLSILVQAESVLLATAGMAAPFVIERPQGSLKAQTLRSANAKRGDVVRFSPPRGGSAFYIAVAGGFDVPKILGSRSTYTRAALGGFMGRALQAGDDLPLRCSDASKRQSYSLDISLPAPGRLRVLRGPNADYFGTTAFETLLGCLYTIAPASDRMGLRLEGEPLRRAINAELLSQGTAGGALQVPSSGQPILLLADRQTTGGYPCIATVIGADLAAAGRLAPGMSVRFAEVTREEALHALSEERRWLASLPSLRKPLAEAISSERLFTNNLIGGVISAANED